MQWNTIFFSCVALLLAEGAYSYLGCLQRSVTILNGGQEMECDSKDAPFLRTLDFRVYSGTVELDDSSLCFITGCCNSALVERRLPSISTNDDIQYDYEDITVLGKALNAEFSCNADGFEISNRTARCETFEEDGSGWNLVQANKAGTLCTCKRGNYVEAGACKPCPQGHYSDEDGAAECTRCPRGTYTEGEGASQCLYCPAGHTTYTYNPNVCVGPGLNIYSDRSGQEIFSARVSYDTLGSLVGKSDHLYWGSIGDWSLMKSDGTSFATIRQKFTTSYRTGPRRILKRLTTSVKPNIKDVYCYEGSGEGYKGYESKAASGASCTGPYCRTANGKRICYCQNQRATHGHWKPYCETASGTEEDCDIPKCSTRDPDNVEVVPCTYEKYGDVSDSSFATDGIEFNDQDSAQKICDKLGGECRGVWGKGSSWRITALSLSQGQLGSGPYLFYRKRSECVNPYYEYYFEQKWGS